MQRPWFSRLFFGIVAAFAVAGLISGAACTKWGHAGPVPPTLAPISSLYVSARTGSDTSGNGSQTNPYRTISKAVAVITNASSIPTSGVEVYVAGGDYNAALGEKFPIVVPATVTFTGTNFGNGPVSGSFLNGSGEDLLFERLLAAPSKTAFATFEVAPGASVTFNGMYVGDSKLTLPGSSAQYNSVDVLGSLSSSDTAFGADVPSTLTNVAGIIIPGGSLTCSSCQVHGNDFGIAALSVPIATASPSSVTPSITLNRSRGNSTISAKDIDIVTDGSVNVNVADSVFAHSAYAFEDGFHQFVASVTRGALDFGGGSEGSVGGNVFIGAHDTEISIVRRFETVSALGDTWNPNQQQANGNGQYAKAITFASGADGKNVKILRFSSGSTVMVGPAPVPTPTPSTTPSTGPTATTSPSPT